MDIQHVLTIIGIVVTVTCIIITATCGLALKWINIMREDFCLLRVEFGEFVKTYYVQHEKTIKREECSAKHAILDQKVDKLHERVDAVETDRR